MRFSVLFLFLVAIVGLTLWQNRPKEDPLEEAGKKVIAQMKREAALKEAREAMSIEERQKDAAKLQKKHPKLLDECLKMGQYRRSHLHVHQFLDGSKIAVCSYSKDIDYENFSGKVFYQAEDGEVPQVIELGGKTDNFVGFDQKKYSLTFTLKSLLADEHVFFRDSWIPTIRNTYNCSAVTKECALERRKKCMRVKEEFESNEYLEKYKADYNYTARIDESDKDYYEAYYLALLGGKESSRTISQFKLPKESERKDRDLLLEEMRKSLRQFRRAGCL